MRSPARLIVVCSVVAALAPARPAAAQQTPLAPPFSDARAGASCIQVPDGCSVRRATADAQTGAFEVALAASGPRGQVPVPQVATAWAQLRAGHDLTEATPALLYTATLDLQRLGVSQDPAAPSPSSVRASLQVRHASCSSCTGRVERLLASPGAGQPGTQRVLAVVVDQAGGLIPPGHLDVTLEVAASLGILAARASAEAAGTARLDVEAAPQPIELGPPVARFDADRFVSSAPGTVAQASAAASADTGRMHLDLQVTSPAAGTLPGQGRAVGQLRLPQAHEGGRAVVWAVDVLVRYADAFASPPRLPGSVTFGEASVDVSAFASEFIGGPPPCSGPGCLLAPQPCVGCEGATTRIMADSRANLSMLDRPLRLYGWAAASDGETLHSTTMDVLVLGNAVLDGRDGVAWARLDGTVTALRAFVFD